jgi:hypothetical protein
VGPSASKGAGKDDWAGVIDALYSEHGYILDLLNSLERQVEKLNPGKVPDYQSIDTVFLRNQYLRLLNCTET